MDFCDKSWQIQTPLIVYRLLVSFIEAKWIWIYIFSTGIFWLAHVRECVFLLLNVNLTLSAVLVLEVLLLLLVHLVKDYLLYFLDHTLISFTDSLIYLLISRWAFSYQTRLCNSIPIPTKKYASLFAAFRNTNELLFNESSFISWYALLKWFLNVFCKWFWVRWSHLF